MKAPMSRVLPTPVASAKQSEGNSRSKSATVGNSLRIADKRSLPHLVPFLGRRDLGNPVEDLQRVTPRRAQAQATGDGVDVAVHDLVDPGLRLWRNPDPTLAARDNQARSSSFGLQARPFCRTLERRP